MRRQARADRRGGFSMLELVLVISITIVLAAVAVPRYGNSLGRYRAELAGRRIVADLDLARSRAIASRTDRTVSFSAADDQYELPGEVALIDPADVYVVSLADRPYLARIVSADFGGDEEVVFDGWGGADTCGTVVVQCGSTPKTIVLDAQSGRARCE